MSDWEDKTPAEEQTLSFFARGMRVLWELAGAERKRLAIVFLLIVALKALSITFPYLLKLVFDELPSVIAGGKIPSSIFTIIAAMFIVRIGGNALDRFVRERMFAKSIITLENAWPVLAQQKLLDLSMSFHERENIGKKIAKINKGVEKLTDVLVNLHYGFVPAILYIILNVAAITLMDWKLGLIFFAPLIPALALSFRGFERFTPAWEEWEKQKEVSHGVFCQSVINISTVQGYVQETYEKDRLSAVRHRMRSLDLDASYRIQKYFFGMGALLGLFFLATIAAGVWFVHLHISTIGTVVFIIATGNVTLEGVWEIVFIYTRIMRNLIAAVRMKELLEEPIAVRNNEHATAPATYNGAFVFDKVSFNYRGREHCVLEDFSLKIAPGEFVALVGKSGEGKTTAIRLLTRTYDIDSGRLTLDGIPVRDIHRDWYRRLFAIVQQDVDIFDDTLRANVAYAYPNATEEQIERAVRAAALEESLILEGRFSNGLDTEVGERGVRLSGGERQRVGIARAYLALLCGAKILVLDEATSNLDSGAERSIQEMIEALRTEKSITIVAIAHRLSTIHRADKICVIGEGRVQERGSHKGLMKKNGLYSQLVQLQQLGELRE
ncbi:ABC transporter ATP-binding protein/permease [Patescibacteria group bacterium]|nr:ABC transporter ATP-binding protein/permease [Patescibacteria group bacterium]MBU1034909.1 ABC transporter ATP-binding protein/permease [Patescibacteria group bacterium]MBU1629842.1 ABC transporter ATP-binding protein/permease [Patescibacteria group bacterium]MBU1907710.1 ABC transporter ATP-binding protein/permease [Patescibacteria group bacterium]